MIYLVAIEEPNKQGRLIELAEGEHVMLLAGNSNTAAFVWFFTDKYLADQFIKNNTIILSKEQHCAEGGYCVYRVIRPGMRDVYCLRCKEITDG